MDSGNFIHIVTTVIGIIGAGAVALVCDMLKTSNERLREANLELQTRREEEQRRAEQALEHLRRLAPLPGERRMRGGPPRSLPALAHSLAAAETGHATGDTMPEARLVAREFLQGLAGHVAGGEEAEAAVPAAGKGDLPAAAANEGAGGPRRRKNWEMLLKGPAQRTTIDVTPVAGGGGRPRGALIPFESLQSDADAGQLRGDRRCSGG